MFFIFHLFHAVVIDQLIGSLPHADLEWLVPDELDNARISLRISASRSGRSSDTLINLINAADLEFCLLLHFLVEPTLYLSTGDRMPSFLIAASRACFNS